MAKNDSLIELEKDRLVEVVSNSMSMSDVITSLGYSKSGEMSKRLKDRLEFFEIDISHFRRKSPIKRNVDNIFVEGATCAQKTLRDWYLKGNYSEYECSICGLDGMWQGKVLSLTLDHINGNNTDNKISNLRWVCPNCDRQLETFGSKNRN